MVVMVIMIVVMSASTATYRHHDGRDDVHAHDRGIVVHIRNHIHHHDRGDDVVHGHDDDRDHHGRDHGGRRIQDRFPLQLSPYHPETPVFHNC